MRLLDALVLSAHAKDSKPVMTLTNRHGLRIRIEHKRGTKRELHDDTGKLVYSVNMYNDYGYIEGSKGRDGDEVDCFLGPVLNAKEVYIVDMKDMGPVVEEREDEDKCFIGFQSADAAKTAFLLHYPKNFYEGMTSMSVDKFKKSIKVAALPHRRKKLTARGCSVTLLIALLLSSVAWAQTAISGTWKNPDMTNVTGTILVALARPSAANACSTPAQVVSVAQKKVLITAGTMGALSLYASPCLTPQHTPTAFPQASAGTGATTTISGTNLQATVTLTTGTGPTIGKVATALMTQASFSPAPVCVVTSTAASDNRISYTWSSTSITFSFSKALSASTSYTIAYYCASIPYVVDVYDSTNKLLYHANWVVPNTGSVNVTLLNPVNE